MTDVVMDALNSGCKFGFATGLVQAPHVSEVHACSAGESDRPGMVEDGRSGVRPIAITAGLILLFCSMVSFAPVLLSRLS